MDHGSIQEGMKLIPPAGISAISLFGIDLSSWVYLATLIYIILNICFMVYDRFKGGSCGKTG